MGNMGWVGVARMMIRSLDKKRSLDRKRRCSTMPWSYLIMRTCIPSRPPLSPSPRSPSPAPLSLQRIVEDDVFGGGNAPMETVYRGQGDSWGGERSSLLLLLMLLLLVVVVVDVLVFII